MFLKGDKAAKDHDNAPDPLVAVDIGTSKIRLIAGSVDEENIVNISYYAEVSSSGVSNSSVSSIDKLADKLAELIDDYENKTGRAFSHCVMGISGRHIESCNESGSATVPTSYVTVSDRDHAIEDVRAIVFGEYKHLIHLIPNSYTLSGTTTRDDPINMRGSRLKVNAHLINCNEDQESNFRSAFTKLTKSFNIDHVIYSGIAAADAVLTEEEKEIGVCLIDIGGGSVNVSVYDQNDLVMTFGVEQGGTGITREIATRYGIPLSTAEMIKVNYGLAHPALLTEENKNKGLSIPVNNGEEPRAVAFSDLAKVIGLKLSDILKIVSDRIDHKKRTEGIDITLGAGFVLTGGVACTRGMATLASNMLAPRDSSQRVKARVGIPCGVTGSDEVAKPDCATAVGLLRFANSLTAQEHRNLAMQKEEKASNGVIKRGYTWIRNWLAHEF